MPKITILILIINRLGSTRLDLASLGVATLPCLAWLGLDPLGSASPRARLGPTQLSSARLGNLASPTLAQLVETQAMRFTLASCRVANVLWTATLYTLAHRGYNVAIAC